MSSPRQGGQGLWIALALPEWVIPQWSLGTALSGRAPRYWTLTVEGEASPVDLCARFLLPVYEPSLPAAGELGGRSPTDDTEPGKRDPV